MKRATGLELCFGAITVSQIRPLGSPQGGYRTSRDSNIKMTCHQVARLRWPFMCAGDGCPSGGFIHPASSLVPVKSNIGGARPSDTPPGGRTILCTRPVVCATRATYAPPHGIPPYGQPRRELRLASAHRRDATEWRRHCAARTRTRTRALALAHSHSHLHSHSQHTPLVRRLIHETLIKTASM